MQRETILVADDDAFFRRILEALLTKAGYGMIGARDGSEALEIALGNDAPRIMLLDWMMPAPEGVEVCRELRRQKKKPRPYVMLVTGKNTRQDMLDGLDAGADDFVTKPYAPDELLARVRVAERVLAATGASSSLVMEALSEALRGPGGEVVVRRDEAVGRIFVHDGKIAWAHISTEPSSLYDLLEPDSAVSSDDMRAVLQEAKETGKNFSDVLISWGLADRALLRERLRRWISRKLDSILHLPQPSVLFVPASRKFAGDLSFSLGEVLVQQDESGEPKSIFPGRRHNSGLMQAWKAAITPERQGELDGKLQEAMQIGGAGFSGASEWTTGTYVSYKGERPKAELGLELMKTVRALGDGEAASEVVITTATKLHMMRPITASPGHYLHLVLDINATSLALARIHLASVTGQRG